jgi:hypothetical protein
MLEKLLVALVAPPFLLGAAVSPVDHAQVVFSFQDDDIIESSGLVAVGGLVVTTNDSGDTGRVFTVDPATGKTVGVTGWGNDPADVEALAPLGDHEVWAGDIGDNTESRDSIQVSPVPVGPGDKDVDAPVYDLVYPDGAHNAETLMTNPVTGRLYVATKGALGGTLYAAPVKLSADHPNALEPLGDVLPIATDGAFLPDGKHFVVRNYGEAAIYAFPSLEEVDEFQLPAQPQGEGIAVGPDGTTLLLSSEGLHSKVLELPLPQPDEPSPSDAETAVIETQGTPAVPPTDSGESERPAWPWFLGGVVGLGCIVVLVRSLRPR